jgi:tryptophanase
MNNPYATFNAEPYKIKVIEPIHLTTRSERETALKEAHNNIAMVPSDKVHVDLTTDSGTGAMSHTQWGAMMVGDESYCSATSFFRLKKAVQEVLGFSFTIPVHQGRGADNILWGTIVKPGKYVLFNQPFTSSDAHVLVNGGIVREFLHEAAYDSDYLHPFKGNLDIDRAESFIKEVGAEEVTAIMLTITNNEGGGQPVSMENIRDTSALAKKYNIPLYIDAARCVDNAYLIKIREEGYADKSLNEILLEIFTYADGCTFSAKKCPIVNIGGFIALRDEGLYQRCLPRLTLYEGFPTYGGMSGRDMEALAQGLYEMRVEAYIANHVRQLKYLGSLLMDNGIPLMKPIGGHGVFVDAAAFLPHIHPGEFPAYTLCIHHYLACGVRGAPLGTLTFAKKNQKTGEWIYPKMQLYRLTPPRRVYTDRHLQVAAEGLTRIYEERQSIRGLRITYDPPIGRMFLAHFETL